jgi:hypothetical protein
MPPQPGHELAATRGTGRRARHRAARAASGPAPTADAASRAALVETDRPWSFGPEFFLVQFGEFVREKCIGPGEEPPVVEVHLAGGDVLDLRHVLAVAPTWVALTVNNVTARDDAPRTRTELVPFARIVRVIVRSCRIEEPQIGFTHDHAPHWIEGSARPPTKRRRSSRARL